MTYHNTIFLYLRMTYSLQYNSHVFVLSLQRPFFITLNRESIAIHTVHNNSKSSLHVHLPWKPFLTGFLFSTDNTFFQGWNQYLYSVSSLLAYNCMQFQARVNIRPESPYGLVIFSCNGNQNSQYQTLAYTIPQCQFCNQCRCSAIMWLVLCLSPRLPKRENNSQSPMTET